MKPITWVFLLLAVVGGAVLLGLRWNHGEPVEAARVRRGAIQEYVLELGKTRLPKIHLITMPFNGRVDDIEPIEGTEVKQGDVLARVVPYDLELSVRSSSAAVQRLEASILENDDTTVEGTGLKQALNFVTSMDRTVEAAAERVTAGSAKYEFAKKNLERMTTLRRSNAVTDDDLDRATLQEVEARADFQQDRLVHAAMVAMQAATALTPTAIQQYIERKSLARAVLEKQKVEAEIAREEAELNQRRGVMESPIDGVVLERSQSNEQVLAAGTVLLRLGNLRELEVEAEVLSQDAVSVKPGQRVDVFGPAIGLDPVTAVVQRVFPAGFTKISSLGVEEQRVMVVIAFSKEVLNQLLENKQLGVDYRVEVRIYTAEKDGALILPRSALFRGEDSHWSVFAVRDGVARLQSVQVGLMNDQFVEIVEGLQEGDSAILAPETNIADGTAVEPIHHVAE